MKIAYDISHFLNKFLTNLEIISWRKSHLDTVNKVIANDLFESLNISLNYFFLPFIIFILVWFKFIRFVQQWNSFRNLRDFIHFKCDFTFKALY